MRFSVLAGLGVIERKPAGRSTIQLTNFGNGHSWSKLPARNLYSSGLILGFQHFTLRWMTELHALKLRSVQVSVVGHPRREIFLRRG